MNLRDLAHEDLQGIIHDDSSGAIEITITAPDDSVGVVHGWVNDINLTIDPGTGAVVSGRQATVSVLISDLIALAMDGIKGVAESTHRPWTIEFSDINTRLDLFKVTKSNPDNGAGLTVLFLEEYKK